MLNTVQVSAYINFLCRCGFSRKHSVEIWTMSRMRQRYIWHPERKRSDVFHKKNRPGSDEIRVFREVGNRYQNNAGFLPVKLPFFSHLAVFELHKNLWATKYRKYRSKKARTSGAKYNRRRRGREGCLFPIKDDRRTARSRSCRKVG